MRFVATLCSVIFFAACASTPPAPAPDPAPWSGARLQSDAVPAVYLTEWQKAENRSTCAPLAFASLGTGEGATPRRANFSGGWAVAYDKPGLPGKDASGYDCADCGRSAFGIAGAGIEATDDVVARWPNQRTWADGSSAGWGLEGDTGPGWLAYVKVADQQCLYNVWSNVSREHLEFLMSQLRRVSDR